MQNELTVCNERLRSVLINDKKDNPSKIINVLKSDILFVLKNYMDISSDNLEVGINMDSLGKYNITILATVQRLKTLNCIE